MLFDSIIRISEMVDSSDAQRAMQSGRILSLCSTQCYRGAEIDIRARCDAAGGSNTAGTGTRYGPAVWSILGPQTGLPDYIYKAKELLTNSSQAADHV